MFQTKLRELRESAGYKSQQAFADAFGVAQSTVGGWEAGKREPNYDTTMRLARFFGVSIDELLDIANERAAPTAPPSDAAPPDPAYLEAVQYLEGLSGEALASALRCLQAIKALDDAKAPADAAVILEKNA